MFCGKCGKDMGDNNFCPNCGAPSPKSPKEEIANAIPVDDNVEETTPVKVEKNSQSSKVKSHEPTAETEDFEKRLKKECLPYKILSIIENVRVGFVIGVGVISFLLIWLLNWGEKFGYILFNAVAVAVPFEIVLFVIAGILGIITTIIFIIQMYKRNASSKELFKTVWFEGSDYITKRDASIQFETWDAISFKYNKAAFVVSIIQKLVYSATWTIEAILILIAMTLLSPVAKEYSLFTYGFNNAFPLKAIGVMLIISLIVGVINFVIKFVYSALNKKTIERFRNGEFE